MPFAVTAIQAPTSRGALPLVRATVTRTRALCGTASFPLRSQALETEENAQSQDGKGTTEQELP